MYQKKFMIDNILYLFWASKTSGEIGFMVLRGSSKKGAISHSSSEGNAVDDVNLSLHPLRVFKKIVELALEWIRSNHYPHRIMFAASTARKLKVYLWLVEKCLKNHPDIAKHYYFYQYDHVFAFYRKS